MSSNSQENPPKETENPSNNETPQVLFKIDFTFEPPKFANKSDVSGSDLFVKNHISEIKMEDHPGIGDGLQMICLQEEEEKMKRMLAENNLPTNIERRVLTDKDADDTENHINHHEYFYEHEGCEYLEFWKDWEEILPHNWIPYTDCSFKFLAKLGKEQDNIPKCCKKIMIENEILSPPETLSLKRPYNEIDTETNSKDEKSSSQ